MVVSFRAQILQKSRKCHDLPRKLFHFKPLIPTHPGRAVLGNTGREGGKEEEGRRKIAGREEEGRKVGGREEGGRRGGRTKVGVRGLDGRKVGVGGGKRGREERGREGGRRKV